MPSYKLEPVPGGWKETLETSINFYNKERLLHREDGPAITHINGAEYWYNNGQCHRLDGPAATTYDGIHGWYINDQRINCESQQEFEHLMKLKAFW